MTIATIWKTSYGWMVEWCESHNGYHSPAHATAKFATKAEAKRAVKMSGATLWN